MVDQAVQSIGPILWIGTHLPRSSRAALPLLPAHHLPPPPPTVRRCSSSSSTRNRRRPQPPPSAGAAGEAAGRHPFFFSEAIASAAHLHRRSAPLPSHHLCCPLPVRHKPPPPNATAAHPHALASILADRRCCSLPVVVPLLPPLQPSPMPELPLDPTPATVALLLPLREATASLCSRCISSFASSIRHDRPPPQPPTSTIQATSHPILSPTSQPPQALSRHPSSFPIAIGQLPFSLPSSSPQTLLLLLHLRLSEKSPPVAIHRRPKKPPQPSSQPAASFIPPNHLFSTARWLLPLLSPSFFPSSPMPAILPSAELRSSAPLPSHFLPHRRPHLLHPSQTLRRPSPFFKSPWLLPPLLFLHRAHHL